MTDNEAKMVIKRLVGISPSESIVRAVNMATDALEEIQQYRAIGTVEEIKKVVRFLSMDNDNGIIEDLQLLNQYQFIGTVEECREAMERQRKNMKQECCGNCKYHVRGEVPGEGEMVCNNGETEEYGIETLYNHYCEEYEQRQ